MGDTNMDKVDDLVDCNLVDPNTGKAYNAPNNGNEDLPDADDWSLDDIQKEQHQAKYGDSIFYEPYVTKPPRGSVEDIQNKLRIAGTRLRKSLNRSLNRDPQNTSLTSLRTANACRDVSVRSFC
jgi:hypothetical protein